MDISRDNYEQWAMEYIEETLTDSERSSFKAFLDQNEDIACEIRSLSEFTPSLSPETIVYPDKETLRLTNKVPLRSIINLLSGVVAASVVIGLIMIADNMASKISPSLETAKIQTPCIQEEIANVSVDTTFAIAETVAKEIIKVTKQPEPQKHQLIVAAKIEQKEESILRVTGIDPSQVTTITEGHTTFKSETTIALSSSDKIIATYPETTLKTDKSLFKYEDKRFVKTIRRSFATLIAPLDDLNPIRRYQTENSRGIEIASIKIGKTIKSQ